MLFFLGSESGLLVNYYGLPSVSLRDVWFHKFARNEPGFRQRDVMCNMNHPNLLGHQCASPARSIISFYFIQIAVAAARQRWGFREQQCPPLCRQAMLKQCC